MAEEGKIKIDKFDGHDFGFWKMQIEDYQYQKKLHKPLAKAKPIDDPPPRPPRSKTQYFASAPVNNLDHVNEFNLILSRLMLVDIKFDDEVQALLLLSSFHERWSSIEDIRRKISGKYSSSLLSEEDKGRAESKTEGRSRIGVDRNQRREDKEVHMAVRDYDDTLVCCIKNTVEDRIIDSGASFHATFYKEELEKFRLHFGKVRLVDDKTLDIAGVGDVILKTSFGTSWTLKDVRLWRPAVERIGMNILASKGNVPDIQKVDIYFCKPSGLGKQKKLSFIMLEKTRKLQGWSKAESTGIREEDSKMLWADLVSTTYLIYHIPYVLIGLRITEEECGLDEMRYIFRDTKSHQVIRSRDITFVDLIYGANLDGSLDTSEGSENSGSFKDSGRLYKEDSEDGASYKEGGSKTSQVRRSSRESMAPVRYSLLENYLLLIENGELESYS
ncbi:hypothetical protein Tco_0732633 [Tanacetum coccineum]